MNHPGFRDGASGRDEAKADFRMLPRNATDPEARHAETTTSSIQQPQVVQRLLEAVGGLGGAHLRDLPSAIIAPFVPSTWSVESLMVPFPNTL